MHNTRLPLILSCLFSLMVTTGGNLTAQNLFVHDWSIDYFGFNVDAPTALCTDVHSNIYSVGYFEDSVSMDANPSDRELVSHGLRDGYINKLDSSGNPIWSAAIGGPSLDMCQEITYDGNAALYVAGTFNGTVDFDNGPSVFNLTSSGMYDAFLMKVDTNGSFIWAVRLGDWSNESSNTVLIDPSSDIYFIGQFSAQIDLNPGAGTQMTASPGDGTFIVRLDSAGNFMWGGDFTTALDINATLDNNGFLYLGGTCMGVNRDMDPGAGAINFSTAGNTEDIFLIKMTTGGNYVWHKTIGNTSIDRATVRGIDLEGNVYLSGIFRGNVDFDPGPGSYMMNAGLTIDGFLCRLDTAGNFIEAINFASATEDIERCFAIQDSDGYFYMMGMFTDAVDFDPGVSTYTLTSMNGALDLYYVCLDSSLNFMWASSMEGTGNQVAVDFCFDPQGNIISTHPLTGTIDTDMGPGSDMLDEYNNTDIFVVRMVRTTPLSSGITENLLKPVIVFPNPAADHLFIQTTNISTVQAVYVHTANGSQIDVSWTTDSITLKVNLNGLPPGLYVLTIESETDVLHEPFIHCAH